ncbi:tRNA lysidine(34) synthetase TilS [Oxalobacteraceae bacterium R-40]|uniref:tRNA(Ile)-lysidine synthase n=1 Tax=Keguizhuia sedimenti TaxID=3064264 RepID=A0ABU1BQ54_9BURK|nr:tRNA lysidine(34) synthetase TilS [Oxalobacteraceae bacterium R-40]
MANSRKSRSLNKFGEAEIAFERALEKIQARVSILTNEKQTSFAVAYSGGLDSSVLLHLACRYAKSKGLKVHAFHIHHGLSPNADAWLEHCRAEAEQQGAIFSSVKAKIDSRSIVKDGVEQAARIARYATLRDLSRLNDIHLLLAAHHRDDQAETLMLQLMRGAGLPGLSGMAALQEEHALLGKGISLGRPLLEVGRAALERYADRHSLSFVTDESNQDASFRRNALRQIVFPLLEEHFPGFSSCVARSASHIRSAQCLLEDVAESDLGKCRDTIENQAAVNLDELAKLSPLRRDNVLRHWLNGLAVQMPSTARLEELRLQFLDSQPDRHPLFELGQVALSRLGQYLILHPNPGNPPTEEILLQWQGQDTIPVPQWHGTLLFERVEQNGIAAEALFEKPIAIRARGGRERLKIASNRPSRTLKNLFQEAGIPVWRREWLPLVYLQQDLIFAGGLGMDVRHCSSGGGIALSWRPDWQSTS